MHLLREIANTLFSKRKRESSLFTMSRIENAHYLGTRKIFMYLPKARIFLAVSMATVVNGYDTTHIAQWRVIRAILDATNRRHWASIAADVCHWSVLPCFF